MNKNTKKELGLLFSTDEPMKKGYFLHDVYGSYSAAKSRAWRMCTEEYKAMHDLYSANGFRITSYNTCFFTVAWDYMKDGTSYRHIETARNSYDIADYR